MGFARNVVAVAFLSLLAFYLSSVGQLTDEAKWGFVGLLGLLAFAWVSLGDAPAAPAPPAQRARPSAMSQPASEPVVAVDDESAVVALEEDDELPPAVTAPSLDGATLRERKLAKITASQALDADAEGEELEAVVQVELDNVHVADEYVVEISPESMEDADIELTVTERRKRHEAIRERIKRRRLGQLAEIRASTARMWEEHATGEDLVALLQTPGHGQAVMVDPEHPKPGHVYGATFIRIDANRILKLRLPLDTGFEAVQVKAKAPELPALVGPDGNPLPLPVGPDGAPLPLPNLPSSSQALSALRDEMNG